MAVSPHRQRLQPLLHDLAVTVSAPVSALSGQDGQIRGDGVQGVFYADCRALSRAVLMIDGEEPEPVMHTLDGPHAVALLSESNISSLLRLTELPEGTAVGLACNTPRGSQNILSSVQSAGLSHIVPVLASVDDPWSIERMLERTRLVVCSDQAADNLRERLPQDVEVILAYRRLDSGGIEMLRDLLAQAEERS